MHFAMKEGLYSGYAWEMKAVIYNKMEIEWMHMDKKEGEMFDKVQ